MEQKKYSILIVDDENANILVLSDMLGCEYTIYTAKNGIDAISKAIKYTPDLILLDILMPEMDGYQTLLKIKETLEIKKIPVIFITGLSSEEDEIKGLSLDAADYITKPFSHSVVKLRVRNQIQIISQMRTIENLGMIDQLTNLPNRRNFNERLEMEWKQAIRENTSISLLMIDLDKFKSINDAFGHLQGDIVLQSFAGTFSQTLRRPGDFAARWGGEEFVVLLPKTSFDNALDIAENIRQVTENSVVKRDDNHEIKFTVSIGVNSLVPTLEKSMNSFISGADDALYAAKAAGRNKVISAT